MAAHVICNQNILLGLSFLSRCGLLEEKWMEPSIVTVHLSYSGYSGMVVVLGLSSDDFN